MSRALAFVIGGASLLALSGLLRGASAAVVEPELPEPSDEPGTLIEPESAPVWIDVPIYEPFYSEVTMNPPLDALLRLIRIAEHTPGAVARNEDFSTFYGGSRFTNFADHPVLTGEKKGVRLSDEMCRNAGYGPGCVSTAAGAFQATRPTWRQYREAGVWGPRLPDFSPESQIEFARRVLWHIGALDLLDAGDVEGAIRAASVKWASLPGSTAQQNPKSMDWAIAQFNDGLTYQG